MERTDGPRAGKGAYEALIDRIRNLKRVKNVRALRAFLSAAPGEAFISKTKGRK